MLHLLAAALLTISPVVGQSTNPMETPAPPIAALTAGFVWAATTNKEQLAIASSMIMAEEARLLAKGEALAIRVAQMRSELSLATEDAWIRTWYLSAHRPAPRASLVARMHTASSDLTTVGEARTGLRRALTDELVRVIPASRDALTAALSSLPDQIFAGVLRGLQLLGDPYRFGSDGPAGYDCSGLMRAIFAPAFVLRSKAAFQFEDLGQAASVHPAPGDLVFFSGGSTAYGPLRIGHVGLYLGADVLLHSASPGGVNVDWLSVMRQPVAWSTPQVG